MVEKKKYLHASSSLDSYQQPIALRIKNQIDRHYKHTAGGLLAARCVFVRNPISTNFNEFLLISTILPLTPAILDYLINQPVLFGLWRAQVVIAVGVLLNLFNLLAGVLG